MGLDMHLHAKKYVSPYSDKETHAKVVKALGGNLPGELKYVEVEVGHWRNANAIHKWFVDKCQDGVDECQVTPITKEQLRTLRELCQKVLDTARLVPSKVSAGMTSTPNGLEPILEDGEVVENPEEVAALLPTQSGFFGCTDYDAWYLEDVRNTVAIIDKALAASEQGWDSFVYHSSW